MLPLDPQGLDNRARLQQGERSSHYRSRPAASVAPVPPVSDVSVSTAPGSHCGPRRRRLVLTEKPTNTHLTETTPLRLSTAALNSSSTPLSKPHSAPHAPLDITAPLAAHQPPGSVRKLDSGFYVDPGFLRLHSPLRHSVTFSGDIDLGCDSPFQSPTVGIARPYPSDMAYTGDKKTTAPRSTASTRSSLPAVVEDAPRNRFPAWFSRANPQSTGASSTSPVAPETRTHSTSSASKVTSPGFSRFNFFGSVAPTASSTVSDNDELMNLDIEKGLFPNGAPVEGTAFSPSAFKNLEMNATGLLCKFQAAYEQRTIEFQELDAERDTRELRQTEAEARIEQLEKQLEDHARQAAERDAFIEHLLNQLPQEKDHRVDRESGGDKEIATSAASTMSEDLGFDEDRQRHWRKSTSTSSDDESMDEASVFSRSRSPTISTSISDMSLATPPHTQSKPVILEPSRAARSSNPQMSAFQKLFKGITSEVPKNAGPDSCRNCQGQEASIAWDTVNLLKDENKGLKNRVEELETAVEGALDVVNGLVL
ncbi:hypothetical protein FZEAL_9156 [Fusarium zealandicum]|uniref:Uncharacterized protein n=1 Tax=Fusarium zealandicum TaxID=1053134 RepID=A0A8H4XH45_9HYPO|nr:hypothetical protein FZEAL_9156 [Fusarium zealandicum]